MKNFKPNKKTKRKKQWIDYKKKRNILKQWQKEQDNRRGTGLSLKQMPVDFPKSNK